MKFVIHRGTKEIGGSCVEVWTDRTRILIDIGMPLVERDGSEFDFTRYKNQPTATLIKSGVLPDVKGIYDEKEGLIDGILISHPHQDHYGLYNYVNPAVKCYIGQAMHKIIEISNIFTPQKIAIPNPVYFEKEQAFQIGDITVTPYWVDHSAFDSYSFLIESGGKSIFYSGDFRGHGRKAKAFKWFTHNAPINVDYLLLEGTSMGREGKPSMHETDVENEFVSLFKEPGKATLVYTSGQNIDRLVSIYRACIRTGKTLIVDVYVATILKEMSKFAKIPHPSKDYKNLKVIYARYTSSRVADQGDLKILYQFKNYKITKEEINDRPDQFVMIVRPSMKRDLDSIVGIDSGNLVYSMWEGYLKKKSTKNFIEYFIKRKFSIHNIHTSGHADISTLKQMVDAIKPMNIVPIHTFNASEYLKIFGGIVIMLNDGQIMQL